MKTDLWSTVPQASCVSYCLISCNSVRYVCNPYVLSKVEVKLHCDGVINPPPEHHAIQLKLKTKGVQTATSLLSV